MRRRTGQYGTVLIQNDTTKNTSQSIMITENSNGPYLPDKYSLMRLKDFVVRHEETENCGQTQNVSVNNVDICLRMQDTTKTFYKTLNISNKVWKELCVLRLGQAPDGECNLVNNQK